MKLSLYRKKTPYNPYWERSGVYGWQRGARGSRLIDMKRILILCWAFVWALGQARSQPAGFLRAKNALIVDDRGKEVILRGMGLGGWMLKEGYMFGIRNEGTQHSIKARIADLVGKADCDKFYRLWLENDITRADVDLLAKAGFNSIRLPMHYNLFTL